MSEETRSIVPMALSMALVLGIVGSWGMVVFLDPMISVYAWVVLIQLTLPVFGVFALAVAVGFAVLKKREWAWLGVSVWLAAIAMWPLAWLFGVGQIPFPRSIGEAIPAHEIRVPTEEPMVVLWGGNELETNHHVTMPDQRWAYDLAVEPVLHGKSDLESYGCWGVEVVAPASGEVVVARDGDPDNRPGRLPDEFEHPFGNHVGIALEGQTFLIVGHLQKDSVNVKPGDSVSVGQPIGACGNSGRSSEPHVHVHHQRENPVEWPPGFAEGLPLYFRDHDANRMPRGGVTLSDGVRKAIGDVIEHQP